VAEEDRLMKDMDLDEAAKSSAHAAYDSFKTQTDGVAGVAMARSQNDLKQAMRVDSSIAAGNVELQAALNVPTAAAAPASSMAGNGYRAISAPSTDANTRVVQYTQRAKYVAGRAFFQNGNQWVDSNVAKQNGNASVRVKFGSDDYFALIANNPNARPWLALGQNIKLVLNNTVYDIYDDAGTN